MVLQQLEEIEISTTNKNKTKSTGSEQCEAVVRTVVGYLFQDKVQNLGFY